MKLFKLARVVLGLTLIAISTVMVLAGLILCATIVLAPVAFLPTLWFGLLGGCGVKCITGYDPTWVVRARDRREDKKLKHIARREAKGKDNKAIPANKNNVIDIDNGWSEEE